MTRNRSIPNRRSRRNQSFLYLSRNRWNQSPIPIRWNLIRRSGLNQNSRFRNRPSFRVQIRCDSEDQCCPRRIRNGLSRLFRWFHWSHFHRHYHSRHRFRFRHRSLCRFRRNFRYPSRYLR